MPQPDAYAPSAWKAAPMETWLVAALQDSRAGSVAPQKTAGVTGVCELVNHIDTDAQNRLHRGGGDQSGGDGDQSRKRRAGAAHVENSGVLCSKFVLQYD